MLVQYGEGKFAFQRLMEDNFGDPAMMVTQGIASESATRTDVV